MDILLVKIFATALALSEVMTQPQAVKTHFDPAQDRGEVVQILRNGCAHMRAAFDIESINLDDLISTALDDPKALAEVISLIAAMRPNWRSSGVATEDAMVSGLAPGRDALTWMVG